MNFRGWVDCLFTAFSKMYVCRTNGASCPSLGTRCGVWQEDFLNNNDNGHSK